MFAPPSTETLNRFFLLSWLVVLWQVLRLQDGIVFDAPGCRSGASLPA